ncbi:hypothetical protein FCH28_29115 [Streptomyces piniterrae]|uniref:Uncharacterized protein n=1 Tax=Streptomyces piniterrae TaxID=2571125 RepID=A0A4U0MWA8_9ACTN|nr:hypothetical protein [Streptomyces piniterrae]TJZ45391.1 hypothetical protein FCH28_29115 [Streptomyces piniterrae]
MSYDRTDTQSPVSRVRLLPWEGEDGNPCFLSASELGGALSRIADEIEAHQLRDAADVINGAQAVLDDRKAGEHALRHALRAVLQCLDAVRRIADSRGARLPAPDYDGSGTNADGDGPQLPAEVFG